MLQPSKTCIRSWPLPTTKIALLFPPATRKWWKTASTRRAAAASPSATAAPAACPSPVFLAASHRAAKFLQKCPSRAKSRPWSPGKQEPIMRLYRILSALLDYPQQDLLDALPEIGRALDAWPQAARQL